MEWPIKPDPEVVEEAKKRIIAALDGVNYEIAQCALQRAEGELKAFSVVRWEEKAREE